MRSSALRHLNTFISIITYCLIIGLLVSCSNNDAEVNQPPLIEDQILQVDENPAKESVIGKIVAEDPENGELIYFIVAGNDDMAFRIDHESGEIMILDNELLNYEMVTEIPLTVMVSDGSITKEANVTIAINDVQELFDTSVDCSDIEFFDPNFQGTSCCIKRTSELGFGQNLVYEYFGNSTISEVEWTASSDEIEIISGANSNTITIKIPANFTEGSIIGLGTLEDGDRCSERISFTVD